MDGEVAATLGLKGKPDPDIFWKCSEIFGVDPGDAAIVDDSLAGVQAGSAGNFALVIGVARKSNSADLTAMGAHWVLQDLSELGLAELQKELSSQRKQLPSALIHWKEIQERLAGQEAIVFLDYDGTLTPIVDHPDRATMSEEMRRAVRELAGCCTTAIVSGRARSKVYEFVKIEGIFYAGSHGFDIAGPGGSHIQNEAGRRFLPELEQAYLEISQKVEGIQGTLVEQTGFSASIHYRLVPEEQVSLVEAAVDEVLKDHPTLRKTYGKKVFEIRPRMDWDKGRAVLWILQALRLEGDPVVPFYLGDDTTDEGRFPGSQPKRDRDLGYGRAPPYRREFSAQGYHRGTPFS